MAIVYLLHNTVNDKLYVGKTVRTLDERWNGHVSCARRNDNDMLICRAIKKHGVNVFDRRVLEICDESIVSEQEKFWIAELKTHVSQGGYNLTLGGEGTSGYKFSDAGRAKLRALGLGRKHSPETRVRLCASAQRRWCNTPISERAKSPETRLKMSVGRRNMLAQKRLLTQKENS